MSGSTFSASGDFVSTDPFFTSRRVQLASPNAPFAKLEMLTAERP